MRFVRLDDRFINIDTIIRVVIGSGGAVHVYFSDESDISLYGRNAVAMITALESESISDKDYVLPPQPAEAAGPIE